MAQVIKGKTQSLQWLSDMLSFFQMETIKTPVSYRERVLVVKKQLNDDPSGLTNSMMDFAINSALVDYRVESDNDNLAKELNTWLSNCNLEVLGKIPTGLEALAKEYFRERWKGSSNLLLRTFWAKQNDLRVPTTMFFLDGEDIRVNKPKNGVIKLGEEKYGIRVSGNSDHDIKLPTSKDEMIFVQRPYESWGTLESVPFLIKRGVWRNSSFLKLITSKGEFVVGKALEYLMIMKKGTERMFLEGNVSYSEEDLKVISDDMRKLIAKKKNEGGTPTYTTNFDTEITEYIPEYSRVISDSLYRPIEKRILAGLGLVDIVEGVGSTRREAILNPKPFMTEVTQGIKDFSTLLTDIVKAIVIVNSEKHPKWMNAKIEIKTSPVKGFMDDKFREKLRSMYDRGVLSKQTFTEVVGDLDYTLEVKRRKAEKKAGHEESMYPPVVQNMEQEEADAKEDIKKEETKNPSKTGPEKKNFKSASKIIGEPKDPRRNADKVTPKKSKKDLPKTGNEE